MRKFLSNRWYACAWDHEVGQELLARTLCGRPVVLFRTADGDPVALEDRCCHRGLPLSLGQLDGDRVVCGYHGLVFDASGTCVEVPGQGRVPPGAGVYGYPVVERHRLLWVWLGDTVEADDAAVPDFRWNQLDGWAMSAGTIKYDCDYRFLIDNLLDLTHETYVHPTSIGNRAVVDHPAHTRRDADTVTVSRWMIDHQPAPLWKDAIGTDDNCDRWQIVEFSLPSIVRLDIGVAPAGTGAPEGDRGQGISAWSLHAIMPETETSCWDFWSFARDFRLDEPGLTEELRATNAAVVAEDREILDAVQKSVDVMAGEPDWVDINVDAASIQARRIIDTALEAEHAAAQRGEG